MTEPGSTRNANASQLDAHQTFRRVDDFALGRALIRNPELTPIDFGGYLRELQAASGRDFTVLVQLANSIPFFLEGPRQLLLRSLSAKFLSKARIGRWEPLIVEVVDEHLQRLSDIPAPDLVRDFANPVFQTVTGIVLGINDAGSPQFSHWAAATRYLLEPMLSLKTILALQDTIAAMLQYIDASCPAHEPERPKSFLNWVLEQNVPDLERSDAVALTAVLFIAGQTTAQTLCNIIYATLKGAMGECDKMGSRAWVADNLEILLRLHASPQFVDRIVHRDQVIEGCPFRAGDHVHVHLPSINRDPAKFGDGTACPVSDRTASFSHLSFGVGTHKCPGAVYARLLLEIALPRLFAMYPQMRMAVDEPEWFETTFIRAPLNLPVHLSQGPRI